MQIEAFGVMKLIPVEAVVDAVRFEDGHVVLGR
jgi:hypothetical protein